MGLAYNLDTVALPSLQDFGSLLQLGDENAFSAGGFSGRLDGIEIPDPQSANYSEFDIIVRDTTYTRDNYIICGSYRAFFRNLGASGEWAWDGFVIIIRAHNLPFYSPDYPPIFGTAGDAPEYSPFYWFNPGKVGQGAGAYQPLQPYSQDNQCWAYVARMPYECAPGLTGIGSDSTPGIYSVDTGKIPSTEGPRLEILAAGHSRIDTTVEGGISGQNYSGWFSNLSFIYGGPTIGPPTDPTSPLEFEPLTRFELNFLAELSFQVSQNCLTNVGNGLPPASGSFPKGINQDLQDLARAIIQTSDESDEPPKLTALGNGYVITRIHDIVGLNTSPLPLQDNLSSLFITGEVAYDNGAGSVDFTTPFIGNWGYQQPIGNPGYLNLFCSVGDRNWALDGDVAAYNLNGAYGTAIAPSFNVNETQDIFSNQIIIAVDRVTHGATTNGELYAAQFGFVNFPLGAPGGALDLSVWPFGVKGGPFETVAGLTLPDKWYGKALQQKTFTQEEEAEAKLLDLYNDNQGVLNPADGVVVLDAIEDKQLLARLNQDPTLQGREPDPINFLAGVSAPNYIDYGQSNKPAFTGQPANIAYGFMGVIAGDGPQIYMYDFGTATMTIDTSGATAKFYVGPNPITPQEAGLDIYNFGSTMNAAIETGTDSTTRIPVSAGWDADRDQWIYTFADSTGGTVLSCNSAFDRQPANQIAYLDQTDQFDNIDSNVRSAYFTPRNMTPFLDGLVLFGGEVDTTQLGQRAIKSILLPNVIFPSNPDTRGFQTFEIQGSTGRTARVWVDYMLYDGVDSLVAVVIQELGLRVTVENVEWYKRKILNDDVLNMTNEEIEAWIDAQQAEYRKMLIDKERQGRLRRRRRQQSAIANELEELLQGEFVVSEMDFIEDDFIERNLRDLNAFPDQDEEFKRQLGTDAQWLEDDSLYGPSVPRKETASERRKQAKQDPDAEESDDS